VVEMAPMCGQVDHVNPITGTEFVDDHDVLGNGRWK